MKKPLFFHLIFLLSFLHSETLIFASKSKHSKIPLKSHASQLARKSPLPDPSIITLKSSPPTNSVSNSVVSIGTRLIPKKSKAFLLKKAKQRKIRQLKLKKLKQKRELEVKIAKRHAHWDFENKIGMFNHDMRKLQMPGGGGGSVVVAPNQGSGIANAQVVVNSLGTPAAEPYANGRVIRGYDPADAEPRVIVTRMKLPTRGLLLKA